jgi:hypothetical protein
VTGPVLVFGFIGVVVWLWREYVYRTEPQPTRHVHRPIVVMDGSVDICECGELVNR